jgi:hypothetical protein
MKGRHNRHFPPALDRVGPLVAGLCTIEKLCNLDP